MNASGELEKPLDDSVVVEMARHGVFLALARHENDLAEFLFSGKAAAAGWNRDQALVNGLRAALAANKAYEYALRLKANCARETTSELPRH